MKILVVDDEAEVGDFLCDFLKRLKLEASKATSGQEALDIFSRDKPDWVLLDIKMPDIDGLEVLRRMREAASAVKVIMITGRDDESSKGQANALGAVDYLVKPIDLDELRHKINKYILNK